MLMFRNHSLHSGRRGYTVKELIAVVVILLILAAIFLPNLDQGRESARRTQCANNLRQIGTACHNYESTYKQLPTGGMEIDLETLVERVEAGKMPHEIIGMHSTFNVIEDFMHGVRTYDWSRAYNDSWAPQCTISGVMNETWNSYHAKLQPVEFQCPANPYSIMRDPAGYGKTDYMPTAYTDIDPVPDRNGVLGLRNRVTTESGCLSVAGTPLNGITDGTSNTIMIAESAGRLPESMPPYMCGEFADSQCEVNTAQKDACTKTERRAFWRWAEPTCAGGISGQRNYLAGRKKIDFVNGNKMPEFGGTSNELSPTKCLTPPTEGITTKCLWSWTNCGPNDEIFAWHSGGANVVMADGAVRLIQSNVRSDILRYLVTRAEGSPLTVTGTF